MTSNRKKSTDLEKDQSENINKNRLQKASKKLRAVLTLEKVRQLPKYKKVSSAQYLQLLTTLEALALLLLESATWINNDLS